MERRWAQEEVVQVSRFCGLEELLKELSEVVPGVTEHVRFKIIRGRQVMFEAANEANNEPEDDEEDDEVQKMNDLLLGGNTEGSTNVSTEKESAVAAAPTAPPHSRILEQPPADNSQFNAQVQEAER